MQFEGHLVLSDVLRFIEEKLGVGIWRCDAAGEMQWSQGFYELLGLDPRHVAPSCAVMNERIHPEDRRPRRDFSELTLDPSVLDGEYRIIRPNGALRWLNNRGEVLMDAAGKPTCFLGITADITGHRKMLQPLRTAAERYNAATQIVGGSLWIAGSDGQITALPNAETRPEARRFWDKGWIDLLHEEDRDASLRRWAISAETGQPYEVEHRMRQPDGEFRWFRWTAAPVAGRRYP